MPECQRFLTPEAERSEHMLEALTRCLCEGGPRRVAPEVRGVGPRDAIRRRALEQDFSEDDLVGCPVRLAPGEGAPASLEPAEELLTQPGNALDYLGHEFT